MQRWVGFLRARGFYAQGHILACPRLVGQAFVVVQGREVLDVSPQAEAEGARRGISVGELRWVCPEAAVVPYEEGLYLPLYRRLWDAVHAHAPIVEPRGLSEGFFDATGCIRGPLAPERWLAALAESVEETTGLKAEIGLGPNRPLAEMASRRGLCLQAEEVASFLAKAPVSHLPQPPEIIEALQRLGVRYVGEIARLPVPVLHAYLGEAARQVRKIARGQGEAHVEALYPPAAITRRVGPVIGLCPGRLRELLQQLCIELWAELERRRIRATLLRLTLDPLDDAARSAERHLSLGIFGPKGLEQAIWALWGELWRGEDLAGAEIELSDLVPFTPQQYDLWGQEQRLSSRQRRLERLRAYLTRRFGDQALLPACQLPGRRRLAEQILAQQAQEWAGAA